MKSKLIAIVFGCAFVLSFLTALISGASFVTGLLRGFGLGAAFAAFWVGLTFVYKKFLFDSQSSSIAEESSASQQPKAPVSGGKVNLVVGEENLSDDGDSPKFTLTGSNVMLSRQDQQTAETQTDKPVEPVSGSQINEAAVLVKEEMAAANKQSASVPPVENAAGFKPVQLGRKTDTTPADEFPPIEGVLNNSVFSSSNDTSNATEESEVDTLPDLGESVSGSMDETVTDSDFATGGAKPGRLNETVFSDGSKASSKDTKLLAEAIRTALKKEE